MTPNFNTAKVYDSRQYHDHLQMLKEVFQYSKSCLYGFASLKYLREALKIVSIKSPQIEREYTGKETVAARGPLPTSILSHAFLVCFYLSL
jgi:hypothetical protein